MKNKLYACIVIIVIALVPAIAKAEEPISTRQLSNIEILYLEIQPGADEAGTPRGKVRDVFKKFEPTSVQDRVAESLSMTDESRQATEKIVLDNGYLDIPLPLYGALVKGFASYHVASSPTFFSLMRPKNQADSLKEALSKQFPPLAEKSDYILMLMPYRVSAQGAGNAVLWIGVNLNEKKTNNYIWTHYITVPFGIDRKGFSEADGERLASILIGQLVKKGWLTAEKNGENHPG